MAFVKALVIGGIADGEYHDVDPGLETHILNKWDVAKLPIQEIYHFVPFHCGSVCFYFLCSDEYNNFSNFIQALRDAYVCVKQK